MLTVFALISLMSVQAATYPPEWDAIAQSVLSSMDMTADPCNDFYQFACGTWTEAHQKEAPYSRSFSSLAATTEEIELELTENNVPLASDFFKSCRDEEQIRVLGNSVLVKPLSILDNIGTTPEDFAKTLAALFRIGVSPTFGFGGMPDFADPSNTIAAFAPGGVLFPPEVYSGSTPEDQAKLQQLRQYADALFQYMPAPYNTGKGESVVAVQTLFASIMPPSAKANNPSDFYHPMPWSQLKAMVTSVDLEAFVTGVGADASLIDKVNVLSDKFTKGFDSIMSALISDATNGGTLIRDAFAFQLVLTYSSSLEFSLREAKASFFVEALAQPRDDSPRAHTCIQMTDQTPLSFAIGKAFVDKVFSPKTKKRAEELIAEVELAFSKRMRDVPWLNVSSEAVQAAEGKLSAIKNKIGYPDVWPSTEGLVIKPDQLFENMMRIQEMANLQNSASIGKPTDKEVWSMSPQTINAYYQPIFNEMVFPAAILRGTFYNPNAPGALNYGGIGGVMGHEMSHGFDNSGRQYNAKGQLKPWWPQNVIDGFKEAVKCVVDLYDNAYVEAMGQKVTESGLRTLGENLADIGGVSNARRAYIFRLQNDAAFRQRENQIPQAFGGLTPIQLYFVGWGQDWCQADDADHLKQQAAADPHSLSRLRAVIPPSQNQAFAEAFQCQLGSKMNPVKKCLVW